MTEKSQKYLSDILRCIDLIDSFTKGISSFEEYQDDLKTQSAVERQLSILGEALNNFRKLQPETEIEHTKSIISFRNRLIHAYDSVDNTIIWAILQRHTPKLKKEIEIKFPKGN